MQLGMPSLAGERVPEPPEHAAAVLLHGHLRARLIAQLAS
jgi:hypothetical protein